LIDLLATGAGPVPRRSVASYFAPALIAGTVAAVVLTIAWLGINPALRAFLSLPGFWVKVAFSATLAAAGLVALARLARPGVEVGAIKWFVAAPVLVLWTMALVTLFGADADARLPLVLGKSWTVCPFNIATLSLPVFVACAVALRRLAPTQLRFTGATAGLCAGAIGALAYCLHCPEIEAPFLGVWYVAGVLIPTAVGYVLGPWLLRW
jgi:hypothetical protein